MRRLRYLAVLATALVACSDPPGHQEPKQQETKVEAAASSATQASFSLRPAQVEACSALALQVELQAGPSGLPQGSELLVGYPHAYYGGRCPGPRWLKASRVPEAAELPPSEAHGRLEVSVRDLPFAGWYLNYSLERGLAPGATALLSLPERAAPGTASNSFSPLVLLRSGPGGTFTELKARRALVVTPTAPTGLRLTVPSSLEPGEDYRARLCLVDAVGNPSGDLPEEVTRRDGTPHLVKKASVSSCGSIVLPAFHETGKHEVELLAQVGTTRFQARSSPILVEKQSYRLVWADLHGHSGLSDGQGSAAAYYSYARDVAHLDAAALSDHDWQLEAAELQQTLDAAETSRRSGDFVSIPALEINLFGHEVAYFFDPQRLAALSPGVSRNGSEQMIAGKPASDYFDPELLARLHPGGQGPALSIWQEALLHMPAARPSPEPAAMLQRYGENSLVVASHSTLAPGMGTAFPLPKAPPAYSLIEIYSAHGSSECIGCEKAPAGVKSSDSQQVSSVREALRHHAPLGFIAAGDSHDGHPGNSRWGTWPGGLTGLWVKELSREGLLEAMQSRRVYATTGQRTMLNFEVDGQPMGSVLSQTQTPRVLRFRVVDGRAISRIDIVRNGKVWQQPMPAAAGGWQQVQDQKPASAHYYYLKVVFSDGAIAWSSPVFVHPMVYP